MLRRPLEPKELPGAFAGVSPDSLGLQADDPELIDKWMAEDGIAR
ncbi:hypothetical protein [Streptomyces sp. NPDC054783]